MISRPDGAGRNGLRNLILHNVFDAGRGIYIPIATNFICRANFRMFRELLSESDHRMLRRSQPRSLPMLCSFRQDMTPPVFVRGMHPDQWNGQRMRDFWLSPLNSIVAARNGLMKTWPGLGVRTGTGISRDHLLQDSTGNFGESENTGVSPLSSVATSHSTSISSFQPSIF